MLNDIGSGRLLTLTIDVIAVNPDQESLKIGSLSNIQL